MNLVVVFGWWLIAIIICLVFIGIITLHQKILKLACNFTIGGIFLLIIALLLLWVGYNKK